MQWRKKFFDNDFYLYILQRDEEEIKQEIKFLSKILDIKSGIKLFDQCCGLGDISLGLAKKGVNCLGIDQSAEYINIANKKAKQNNLDCKFLVKDGFKYVPQGKFDIALNRYTSFGYSAKHQDNMTMLTNVYKSLKKGGQFVLDYYNRYYIENNFQNITNFKEKINGKSIDIQKLSSLNSDKTIIYSCRSYSYKDNLLKTFSGQTRFYSPKDIEQMLMQIGYKNIKMYGSIDGEKFYENSPRFIIKVDK